MHTLLSVGRSLRLLALAVSALALLGLAHAAHAQTFIGADTTIDAAHPVNGYAYIGYATETDLNNKTNPLSPTVNLVPTGRVDFETFVYNSSVFTMTGGSTGGDIFGLNNSTVSVGAGSIGYNLAAYNNSTVTYSGGSITFSLSAQDNSTVNYRGGTTGSTLYAFGNSTFNIFGTGLTALYIGQDPYASTLNDFSLSGTLSDGTVLVNKALDVSSTARLTINGAVVAVPEPGSVALLAGLGVTSAAFLRRRKKAR